MTEANPQSSQIKCPHCGQTYDVRPDQWAQYAGRTINCTRCAQPFTVTGMGGVPAAPAAPQQQSAVPAGAPGGAAPAYGYPPQAPGQQPAYGYQTVYPSQSLPASGWAITSLVGGIVSVVLFCVPILGLVSGILGVIGGILGLKRTAPGAGSGGRGMAVAGLITGGIGCVLGVLVLLPFLMSGSVLIPALSNAREQANRVKCASNMRQLGQAMAMYANNNGGAFPNTLGDLMIADPSLSPAAFVCPDDGKPLPTTGNAKTAAGEIDSGKSCSYVYVGKGVTVTAGPDTVLMYEPLSLHQKGPKPGMNVLFADGHVEWEPTSEAQSILDQQAAGTRPIKLTGP